MFYGQVALEEALIPLATNNLLILDTTILTVKIWSDHLFEATPKEVTDEIEVRKYDLYLLMDIDLPWEDDPLRDFPEHRDHFMDIWKKELETLHARYEVISGRGNERLANGLKAIKKIL